MNCEACGDAIEGTVIRISAKDYSYPVCSPGCAEMLTHYVQLGLDVMEVDD